MPSINPDNSCYCIDNKCPPEGTFNSTLCSYNVAMFISFPHFFLGDESLRENFEGLNPNEEQHGTFADIHSRLAFPINGASRFQINIQLQKSSYLAKYSKFPDKIILPLCWFEFTSGEIPAELKKMICKFFKFISKTIHTIIIFIYFILDHTTYSANAVFLSLQYGSLICVLISAILLLLTSYCFLITQDKRLRDQLDVNVMATMS